jgi:hypothetical protein
MIRELIAREARSAFKVYVIVAAACALLLVLAACVSSRSPLGEMMALRAQGEVACVRNDVVVRGRKACT